MGPKNHTIRGPPVTGNVILKLHYNQIYQLKTTISFVIDFCFVFCFCFLEPNLGSFSTQYWIAVWQSAPPTLAHLTRQNSFYIIPIIITFLGLGKSKKMWKFLMKHHFAKLYLHDAPLHDFHWHFPLFSITKWQIYSVKLWIDT